MTKDEILRLALEKCPHGHSFLEHPKCFENRIGFQEKIGYLDIESSNLNASFGYIISYCIKEEGGKILSRAITKSEVQSKTRDKEVVKSLIEDMKKFTRVVTYYGARFDIPFIRTRAVKWGLEFPLYKQVLHTDVYYMMKHRFKLHSNRLEAACEFFDIPAKGHKLKPTIWQDAMYGDKAAINYILTHNKEDVVCLEELHHKAVEYARPTKNSI